MIDEMKQMLLSQVLHSWTARVEFEYIWYFCWVFHRMAYFEWSARLFGCLDKRSSKPYIFRDHGL